jgi:hypothetical protein
MHSSKKALSIQKEWSKFWKALRCDLIVAFMDATDCHPVPKILSASSLQF